MAKWRRLPARKNCSQFRFPAESLRFYPYKENFKKLIDFEKTFGIHNNGTNKNGTKKNRTTRRNNFFFRSQLFLLGAEI